MARHQYPVTDSFFSSVTLHSSPRGSSIRWLIETDRLIETDGLIETDRLIETDGLIETDM